MASNWEQSHTKGNPFLQSDRKCRCEMEINLAADNAIHYTDGHKTPTSRRLIKTHSHTHTHTQRERERERERNKRITIFLYQTWHVIELKKSAASGRADCHQVTDFVEPPNGPRCDDSLFLFFSFFSFFIIIIFFVFLFFFFFFFFFVFLRLPFVCGRPCKNPFFCQLFDSVEFGWSFFFLKSGTLGLSSVGNWTFDGRQMDRKSGVGSSELRRLCQSKKSKFGRLFLYFFFWNTRGFFYFCLQKCDSALGPAEATFWSRIESERTLKKCFFF